MISSWTHANLETAGADRWSVFWSIGRHLPLLGLHAPLAPGKLHIVVMQGSVEIRNNRCIDEHNHNHQSVLLKA